MKNKKIINIIFDVIMAVVLILSYYRQILGWQYHAYISLIFGALALIHLFINHKWCRNTLKRGLSKSCDIMTRIICFINIALFVCGFLAIYSGILMSRTILPFLNSQNEIWKSVHSFTANATMILVILHIVCHFKFIKSILFKKK